LWAVIGVVMLTILQRYLIFQPIQAQSLEAAMAGLAPGRIEDVSLRSDDGLELHGWFVRGQAGIRSTSGERPVAICFPGNAGHRGYRGSELDLLSSIGCDVYLFDYRGYGDNLGRPSEASLAADAQSVWRYVTGPREVAPGRIVLVGESLGGGVASRLAAEVCLAGTPPAGLILKSTFSSLADVGSYHYPWLPVRLLLTERFPSIDRIHQTTCPILMIHGTEDLVVPEEYGRRLFDAAPPLSREGIPKTFVELRGAGHNDILFLARDQYRAAVETFLERIFAAQGAGTGRLSAAR
jgi:fermentation-respiration switch protein FrsA (DUF1100 family)